MSAISRRDGPALRVLFVSHYAQMYGANLSLLDLLEGLPRRGIECLVICPGDGPAAERFRETGCQVVVREVASWCMRAGLLATYNPFGKIYLIRRTLRSLLRPDASTMAEVTAFSPNVVYTNTSVTCLGHAIARRLRLPHVWHLHEFAEAHFDLRFILGRRLSHRIILRASAVVANSRALRDHFDPGGSKSRVHVIYNGVVSGERLAALDPARLEGSGPLRLLMVGTPHPKKGYETVLAALREVNRERQRATLAIAGGGEGESAWIRDAAEALGVGRWVHLLGYVDDPLPLYAQFDVFVMASEMEAMGRATAEAMVMGLPVLGHASGGTAEIVRDGETGYLYHGGPPALADAIEKVLRDRGLWRAMGRRAREENAERFTQETYVENVARVLAEVHARRAGGQRHTALE